MQYSRPFFEVVYHFIWKKELLLANHSFKLTSLFWRISLSHVFFHVEHFFHEAAAAIRFLRGYMQPIIFDSSYLLRTATFLEDLS